MSQCTDCRTIYDDLYNFGLSIPGELPSDVELSGLLTLCHSCIRNLIGIV